MTHEIDFRVEHLLFACDVGDLVGTDNVREFEGIRVIVDAGTLEYIRGVEIDFVALVMDNLSFTASIGLQDGEYDSVNPLIGDIEAALGIPVLGPDLPRLADSNYSAGFSWDIPTNSAGLFNVAANYSWREEHPYNDSNTELFEDQERVNAAINWIVPGDEWTVSLYGKNLTDEANWGNLTSISGLYTAGPMQKGRLYGIEVNFRR